MADCQSTHSHTKDTRRLLWALAVIGVFTVVEIIGGLISGSLALLADAVHMMTDGLALTLAASAQWFANKPADEKRHFGYKRWQVLAAFVNGIILLILLSWIVFEGVNRLITPEPVAWRPMLAVALVGLIANGIAFALLHGAHTHNINVRGAMLHVVSDFFGSVAAVMAAAIIALTGWLRIDPILSFIVAGLIARSAISLLKETGHILLEGAPDNIDAMELASSIRSSSTNIIDIHNVHIWQLQPGVPRIILHARLRNSENAQSTLETIKAKLLADYGIQESTVQIEFGADWLDCEDDNIDKTAPQKALDYVATPSAETALAASK